MAEQSRVAIVFLAVRRLFAACSGRRATGLVVVLGIALLAGGGYFISYQYGDQLFRGEKYRLRIEHIEVTPQPEWIKTDVRRKAFEDASLEGVLITERGLAARVADAFALQSGWVAKVDHVEKRFGPRVIVKLQYRQPAAMVLITRKRKTQFLPVDAAGIVLPGLEEFTKDDVNSYLWIKAPGTWPRHSYGKPWGDERIHGAARIAGLIHDVWQPLEVDWIQIDQEDDETTYNLVTRKGRELPWGHAPGNETPREMQADAKLSLLMEIADQRRTLDALSESSLPSLYRSKSVPVGIEKPVSISIELPSLESR